jgi:hypothetical protein
MRASPIKHGDLFKIDICVAMPQHKDILVSKAHGDAPEHEHVMVAIKDAFAAAQRQIEDAAFPMSCASGVYRFRRPGVRGASSLRP